MYLFVDVETTGVPRDRNAPFWRADAWPRVVELAWAAHRADGGELHAGSLLVRPDGFQIPAEATQVHGITTRMAEERGVAHASALEAPVPLLEDPRGTLVAHNLEFDRNVLGAELIRGAYTRPVVEALLVRRPAVCTMRNATEFCGIPGRRGSFKWPTLEELHRKLFGAGVDGGHRALADVRATARCFFRLRELGVVG